MNGQGFKRPCEHQLGSFTSLEAVKAFSDIFLASNHALHIETAQAYYLLQYF